MSQKLPARDVLEQQVKVLIVLHRLNETTEEACAVECLKHVALVNDVLNLLFAG